MKIFGPYSDVERVYLIGGGDLMLSTAQYLLTQGRPCAIILAPRHASETLPIDGRVTLDAVASLGIPHAVTADMDADRAWEGLGDTSKSLCLCFGPAWIFSEDVVRRFGYGMFNFNGIPFPEYTGGAHYTWQIMNNHRTGGCFIQEITNSVDRGDIVEYEYFKISEDARYPIDYFRENFDAGLSFLKKFIRGILDGATYSARPCKEFMEKSIYLPRLITKINGVIDWSWNAHDIARFCDAFDTPYPGASTCLEDGVIYLHDVRVSDETHTFHPFVSGLVVRRTPQAVFVAARDGLLRIGGAVDDQGRDRMSHLKVGTRLFSNAQKLQESRAFRPRLGS